jgi:hypothetical protein
MQRQHNGLLVLQVVGGDPSAFTIKDELVSSISVLE